MTIFIVFLKGSINSIWDDERDATDKVNELNKMGFCEIELGKYKVKHGKHANTKEFVDGMFNNDFVF